MYLVKSLTLFYLLKATMKQTSIRKRIRLLLKKFNTYKVNMFFNQILIRELYKNVIDFKIKFYFILGNFMVKLDIQYVTYIFFYFKLLKLIC